MLYSTIAKGLKAGPTPVLPVGFDPEETTTTTTSASKKSKSATSPIDTTKLKTRLCRHFSENNHCPFGDKCAFAHGQSQVTAAPANDDALSAPETEDVALPVATTTTIKAATPAPSTASDSDDQSSSAPSSSVNIPVPRSRAAAASLPTGPDGTTAVISPRPELMSALPRSASRASLLSNTAAPPKYGFATSRTVSRMSLGGLSDTTDTTFVAPPPASLRRRPTGGVVSRVPSSTAASSSQNQLPPPPPTYESSVVFSDDHSAHSGDGGFGRSALHGGCPPNCTCNECTSYDGANWHFQREEVLTPVSQVQTSSPNKSRIPSPMAAGGSGRFSFNPYDPVTPFVMSY